MGDELYFNAVSITVNTTSSIYKGFSQIRMVISNIKNSCVKCKELICEHPLGYWSKAQHLCKENS